MRQYILLPFLMVSITVSSGQKTQIIEVKKPMSAGENNGLEMVIPNTSIEDVENALNAKVKFYKGKFNKPSGGTLEYISSGCKITTISASPTNIYSYLFQEGSQVRVINFYLSDGSFISSAQNKKFEEAVAFSRAIYNKIIFDQMQIKIDAEEKVLKGFMKEQKNLHNEEEDLENNIKKYNESISESEGEIKEHESKKLNNDGLLSLQKEKITAKEKELKAYNKIALENEIDQLENEIEELEKINNKLKGEIKSKQKEPEKYKELLSTYEKQHNENKHKLLEKENIIAEKENYLKVNVLDREDQLEELIKERDKIIYAIKQNEKTVADNKRNIHIQQGRISQAESNLSANKTAQKTAKEKISKQQEVVNELTIQQNPFR
jgi:hypothetical protein